MTKKDSAEVIRFNLMKSMESLPSNRDARLKLRKARKQVASMRTEIWKNGATCDFRTMMIRLDEVQENLISVQDYLTKHLKP